MQTLMNKKDFFVINGGYKLSGEIPIQASKNSTLALITAAILCKDEVIIKNIPFISDITSMVEIINRLGGVVTLDKDNLIINSKDINKCDLDEELTKKTRASILFLGALLNKCKHVQMCYPGGCEIGARPIDLHINALRQLNVTIEEKDNYLICDSTKMHGGEIKLDFASVGATENIILATTCLNQEITIIKNAAKEPEIVDLQNFINKMGGNIEGAGTDTIRIKGVENLNGIIYTPISDRIVAGTFMCAVAACKGEVLLNNAEIKNNFALVEKLRSAGCIINAYENNILVKMEGRPKAVDIITGPYPEFHTDLQAQFTTVMSLAKGISLIQENIFENRFRYTTQLNKMGAEIYIKDKQIIVYGKEKLNFAKVEAFDLRGGAAVLIAALATKGESILSNIHFIDRGYCNLEQIFTKVGAKIVRKNK